MFLSTTASVKLASGLSSGLSLSMHGLILTRSLHLDISQPVSEPMPIHPTLPWPLSPLRPGDSVPMLTPPDSSILPQICAVPKRKITPSRSGNRRVWYQLKRKTEVALCIHCGAVGARGDYIAGKGKCSGACHQREPEKPASDSYTPPC